MEQIIMSLLDTDMYKFSMGQAIFHQYNTDTTTWAFKRKKSGRAFGFKFNSIRE